MIADNLAMNNLPFILEVIGLAGSGKTTLADDLYQQEVEILPGDVLRTKNPRHIPTFVRHGVLASPSFFNQSFSGHWSNWREMKRIAYLEGWHRILKNQSCTHNAVVLVDQGPIYNLATLSEFGPDKLQSRDFAPWWESMYKKWAATLNLVIWLDAPTHILIERIRHRSQLHFIKQRSTEEIADFLLRYKAAYEHVISTMLTYQNIEIIKFDTSTKSLDSIVSDVTKIIHKLEQEYTPVTSNL